MRGAAGVPALLGDFAMWQLITAHLVLNCAPLKSAASDCAARFMHGGAAALACWSWTLALQPEPMQPETPYAGGIECLADCGASVPFLAAMNLCVLECSHIYSLSRQPDHL